MGGKAQGTGRWRVFWHGLKSWTFRVAAGGVVGSDDSAVVAATLGRSGFAMRPGSSKLKEQMALWTH